MPAVRFRSDEETEAVIDYVMVLASRGQLEIDLIREAETELDEEDDFDPEVVATLVTAVADSWRRAEAEVVRPLTVNPPRTEETVRAGAVAFAEFACVTCHGADARGSKSADVGQDVWGRTAYPANLALGMLHGGRRPVDIYRRISSGINGTPMPASKDPNTATGETPEQRSDRIWHLVHFVTAVIEGNRVPPDCQELILDVLQQQAVSGPPQAAPVPAPR
jgi:mono/diheme cytochrome c family protein